MRGIVPSLALVVAAGLIAQADPGDAISAKSVTWRGDTAAISVLDRTLPYWTYDLTTTADLRDGVPASKRVRIVEEPGSMVLRTGHDLFDGLFALALQEAREARAQDGKIQDPGFANGDGVDCDCFESGRKWRYVWTRDTAYAVHLALGLVDPERALNSLLFKVSGRRAAKPASGDRLEIVQDTGSGGSWPVSTDRVTWALGAWELLKYLDGDARTRFRDTAYEAIANTLESDREAAFDPRDGLFRGEHSFMDWREQVYPSWTKADVLSIGASKSLSTNVLHARALEIASSLAQEKGLVAQARKYAQWAADLQAAINRELWLEDRGLYSSLRMSEAGTVPSAKFDLLGESLAVLFGIADPARARKVVAEYPRTQAGTPVIWPQQPLTAIYHNRAIWPFVTAYAIRAAAAAGNDVVMDHDVDSLVRGAALNLSNMENFEFLTQSTYVADGDLSGPVVNSQRQLWSVAGYLSTVVHGMFGMDASQAGVRFVPALTRGMRNRYFGASDRLRLYGIRYRGRWIDVELELPPADGGGAGMLVPREARLNGKVLDGGYVAPEQLLDHNLWQIRLEAAPALNGASIDMIKVSDAKTLTTPEFEQIWAPKEPRVLALEEANGRLQLRFDSNGEDDVVFYVYRNGRLKASAIGAGTWVDADSAGYRDRSLCYTVEAEYASSQNRSHRSKAVCRFADGALRFSPDNQKLLSPDHASIVNRHGRVHYDDWGRPGQTLVTTPFKPSRDGIFRVELEYGNAYAPVSTGVTAAVKRVQIVDRDSGQVAAEGIVFMPQLPSWPTWGVSSALRARLSPARNYEIRVSDHYNMSYLSHFALYTAGAGGSSGPLNRANLAAVTVTAAAED